MKVERASSEGHRGRQRGSASRSVLALPPGGGTRSRALQTLGRSFLFSFYAVPSFFFFANYVSLRCSCALEGDMCGETIEMYGDITHPTVVVDKRSCDRPKRLLLLGSAEETWQLDHFPNLAQQKRNATVDSRLVRCRGGFVGPADREGSVI